MDYWTTMKLSNPNFLLPTILVGCLNIPTNSHANSDLKELLPYSEVANMRVDEGYATAGKGETLLRQNENAERRRQKRGVKRMIQKFQPDPPTLVLTK